MGKKVNYPLKPGIDEYFTWIASKGHHDKKLFIEKSLKKFAEVDYFSSKILSIENVEYGWFIWTKFDYEFAWEECEKSTPRSVPITFIHLD